VRTSKLTPRQVVRAEADLEQQQEQIAAYQKVFDESRYAVALAGKQLKTFQAAVETGRSQGARKSRILSSVTQIINATNDHGQYELGTGADLDKIAERYEQAKAQYEDSQGERRSASSRKKQAQNLDEVEKRLESAGRTQPRRQIARLDHKRDGITAVPSQVRTS